MRTITIGRKREILKPAAFYYVYCDGKLTASVPNGKSISFEIDEDVHTLHFERKIRHYGGTVLSNVLPIPAGEQCFALVARRHFGVHYLEFAETSDPTENQ